MRRFFGYAVLGIAPLLLAGMISPAVAAAGVGPPGGGVQHQFTNGPFATATWFTQTAQTLTLTSVAAARHPGGGTELTVSQEVETLATGSFSDTEVDVSSGFTFTIDATHFTAAAVHGTGLPAQTCDDSGCSLTTFSVSATWTGQGAITRGAVNSKDIETRHNGNFLYIQLEHFAGASRNATASGTIGAQSYTTADALAPAILGNMHTGYIFLCLDGGCEN